VDLSSGTREEREQRTREEVARGSGVIYQPALKADVNLDGRDCELVGDPDFLIREGDGYIVRDVKIARRITEADHPEILRQLETYGWLFEQSLGRAPVAVQAYSGIGEIVDIHYAGAPVDSLRSMLALKLAESEPYTPVGWSKCSDCGFRERCWGIAEEGHDIALVVGVDQGLATALRKDGIRTIDQFLHAFDEQSLAAYERPWGKRMQRVGKSAITILRMARAMASGEELALGTPSLPDSRNYAMFDVEGLPPQLDELEKTYLWGLQVFGERPSEFEAATAGFGPEGDRDGWVAFLVNATRLFSEYGDLPFVHWHHYERTRLDLYVERFGDPDGVAARVRKNLLDLLPITQRSIALPLPSYSLKVVEQYIGFRRTQDEYGGTWAMAKYIEATETEDQDLRAQVMDEILAYNREDLEAAWAVLKWLESKAQRAA
jgi:predicted RecB family nuclease